MPIFNKYELDVDLKREYTTRQISLAQAESGLLIFRIFDDGEIFDMTDVTRAVIYQKTPGCMLLENECELVQMNGMTVVRYEFEKITTIETGFSTLVLTLYDGERVVNIKPFNVLVYPNLQGTGASYLELIQDLMEIIDNLTLDLTTTIKLAEKGVPNGVATLNDKGTIPLAQMPDEFRGYLDHIEHTVYRNQVHGLLINEDGILQYRLPNGVQNAGFAPDAVGGGGNANQVLNATISIVDGVATVVYTGVPTLVANKWAVGERNLAYFALAGNTFNDNRFNVTTTGLHTLWYRDSNANTYVLLFNVNQTQLPSLGINIVVDEGVVVVTTDKPTSIMKWDTGERDIVYFQYNGNIINGNTFNVNQIGKYTVYVKTTEGAEYIRVFDVTANDLPTPDTTPPTITGTFSIIQNGARITVTATDNESGVDYIVKPDGNKVYESTTTYDVNSNGSYRFEAYDKSGNKGETTVNVTGIALNKPNITLSYVPTTYTSGSVVITAVASSTNSNGNIVLKKWAQGDYDEAYFSNAGNAFTVNTFTVLENGYYTVYAEDNLGSKNVSKVNIQVIDRLAPTIIVTTSPTEYTSGAVTVNTRIEDSLSGLREAKWANGIKDKVYFVDNGNIYNGESFQVTENGDYTVYAVDNVGNSIVSQLLVGNIRNTPPVINLRYTPDNYTNGDVTIIPEVTFTSSVLSQAKWASGNRNISYFTTGGTIFNGVSFTVSENNEYTVYVKDSIGNESVAVIRITTIDKERPTINVVQIGATTSSATYRITGTDALSGVNRIQLPDGSEVYDSTTTHTVTSNGNKTFIVYDNAGNFRGDTINVTGLLVNNATKYTVGGNSIARLATDGTVKIFGDNTEGKSGSGTLNNDSISDEARTSVITGVKQVVVTDRRTFFLNTDGQVFIAGSNGNEYYKFTTDPVEQYLYPERIYEISDAVEIVSGLDGESLFYKNSLNEWFAMGKNDFGQLGLGYVTSENSGYLNVPVKITTFNQPIKQIVNQNYSTIFLLEDGYTWYCGRTNLPVTVNNTYTPSRINYQNGVYKWKFVTMSDNGSNAYFIKDGDNSEVYGLGFNYNGELGIGNTSIVNGDAMIIPNSSSAIDVGAGNGYAIIVKSNGTVYGCGKNQNIGQGESGNSNSLTQIGIPQGGAVLVESARSQSIIVNGNGNVFGGGSNLKNLFANGGANLYTGFVNLPNIK